MSLVLVDLCIASNNTHKIQEIKLLLPDTIRVFSMRDIGCTDDIPETGSTFHENAFLKAHYIHQKFNIAALADDSGLEVAALNGAPGIYSARYAGIHGNDHANTERVISEMQGQSNRAARFVCVLCLIEHQNVSYFEGIVSGTLSHYALGTQGFGYDPIFIPDGYSETFSQLGPAVKNRLSHRAIALGKMCTYVNSLQ